MEIGNTGGVAKRLKSCSVDDEEAIEEDGTAVQVPVEENEVRAVNSEQVEMEISHILEKIENFNQMLTTSLLSICNPSEKGICDFQEATLFEYMCDLLSFLKVSMLLESGKSMIMELSNEFEERMILTHKEQIEKWQEEIRELHLLETGI